jgi:hypothetical protein
MKRIPEEREEDRRLQVVAEVLAAENFSFPAKQGDLLVLAFRFHPIRLFRLMQISRGFYIIVKATVEENPRLWYQCVCASFPDFVIALQTINEETYPRGQSRDSRWMRTLSLLHQPHSKYLSNLATFTRELALERAEGYSCYDGYVDHSFTDRAFLDECLHSSERARSAEHSFKMIWPCGIPPAHYCFESQVFLHTAALEFIALSNTYTPTNWLLPFTVINPEWDVVVAEEEEEGAVHLAYITRQDCELWREEGGWSTSQDGRETSGPRIAHSYQEHWGDGRAVLGKEGYTGRRVLQLTDVLDAMRQTTNPRERVLFRSLFDQVAKAALLFSVTDAAPPTFRNLDDTAPYELSEEIMEIRAYHMERYGTYDPLHWQVLLSGEQDAFLLLYPDRLEDPLKNPWYFNLRNLVRFVNDRFGATDPELLRLESKNSTVRLQCELCGAVPTMLETQEPYGAYCSRRCQRKKNGHK